MKPLYPSVLAALDAARAALDDIVIPALRPEARIAGIVDDLTVARDALQRAITKQMGARIDYVDMPGLDN